MKTTFTGIFGKVIASKVTVQNAKTGDKKQAVKFVVKKGLFGARTFLSSNGQLLGDEWIEPPKQFSVFWGSVIVICLVVALGIVTFADSIEQPLNLAWLALKMIFAIWLIFISTFCAFLAFIIAANKIKIESQKLDPNSGFDDCLQRNTKNEQN